MNVCNDADEVPNITFPIGAAELVTTLSVVIGAEFTIGQCSFGSQDHWQAWRRARLHP